MFSHRCTRTAEGGAAMLKKFEGSLSPAEGGFYEVSLSSTK